jgi:thioredoxin reductase
MSVVERETDVLVVGAGPAGLAAAWALRQAGAGNVTVLERESEPGGVPRHCHHLGFGLRDLGVALTGPSYARMRVERAVAAGAEVLTGTSVTGWTAPLIGPGPFVAEVTSPEGPELVRARAVVLATGARERSRAARGIPGDRPEGVYTTGLLQQMVYLHHLPVGRRAVIVGAEHVSYSALLTLRHAGVEPVAMVTGHRRPQTYRVFHELSQVALAVPVLTLTTVERIEGHGRVSAIHVRHEDGRRARIPCDTVILTGDWIPDHELAVAGGLGLDPGTKGPEVDARLRTWVPGVFAAGNLVHPVLSADVAASNAMALVAAVADHLRRPNPGGRVLGVPLQASGGLGWVFPQRVVPGGPQPPHGPVVLWPAQELQTGAIQVRQGDQVLARVHHNHRVTPSRPFGISAGWIDQVDPEGPPVQIQAIRPGLGHAGKPSDDRPR